jgi:hypothetical protein
MDPSTEPSSMPSAEPSSMPSTQPSLPPSLRPSFSPTALSTETPSIVSDPGTTAADRSGALIAAMVILALLFGGATAYQVNKNRSEESGEQNNEGDN